ncbi:MAG: Mn-dependent transcriptional regulator MntR [Candidatus Alkanophagales archaeon MCA70_species_2]|nr:Mn-dependent transcriptional regulator MntR [Candidatus Alkanophaga liquidiphilum]
MSPLRATLKQIDNKLNKMEEKATERAEDYLEAIYDLISKKGYARIIEIAERLNVRPPTVTEMVKKLSEKGLLVHEKYRGFTLTAEGERIARAVQKKHETIANFLRILGVECEIAERDACRIEHNVHPETLERLTKFVEFVQNAPQQNPEWLEHFEHYVKTGEHKCKAKPDDAN